MKKLSDLDDELLNLNDESYKYDGDFDKYDDESDDADEEYEEEDDEDDEDDYEFPIAKFIIPMAVVASLLIIAIIVIIVVTGRTTRKVMGETKVETDSLDFGQEIEDAENIEDESIGVGQEIEDVPDAESEKTITNVIESEIKVTENEKAAEEVMSDETVNDELENAESKEPYPELTSTGQDTEVDTSESSTSGSVSETTPGAEASMNFTEVNETVTAKNATNLRNIPSQGDDSTIVYTLRNGETVTRTGISDSGWSRLNYNGQTVYAVSSYLTTDLQYQAPGQKQEGAASGDGLKTKFAARNESVTAKIEVNLRSLPSVTNPDATVVAVLHNGEYVTRTGINEDVGWSRVDYNGQTLYCVSSYLTY